MFNITNTPLCAGVIKSGQVIALHEFSPEEFGSRLVENKLSQLIYNLTKEVPANDH
jgi:hypothetical protein